MHVVIISDFADVKGGAPRVALESARALADAGATVTYIHAIGSEVHSSLDHPLVESIGLGFSDIWELPPLNGLRTGLWNAAAAERTKSLLAAQPKGETIIHLHQWTRSFSPSIFSVLAKSGHSFVTTLHDYSIACPNGVYYRFDQGKPCNKRPMSLSCITTSCDPRNSLVKAVRTMRTCLTNLALQKTEIDLIHVSDRGQDTILPLLPFKARHHRVDNPVNVIQRPPAQISSDAKIAFVGRLVSEKGVDLAAEAAEQTGVGILFIGDGPLEDEIRRRYPSAECLGWRSPSEVETLLRTQVKAVVAPSCWHETGPLTVYEAMATGIPVIVSDRAGASEKVVHGTSGFVVKPEVGALAHAFREIDDVRKARAMGQAAFELFWAAPPSLASHAASLIEVYRSILGANKQ